MRILTWNIGCFSYMKFAKYLNYSIKGIKINNEYFQPKLNGTFVSDFIEQRNPDIVFLQEIYNPADLDSIPALKNYPHKNLINSWYHTHSILIASKHEFTLTEKDNFNIVLCSGINFIPVHLNSFSAGKRLSECKKIAALAAMLPSTIVLGDTNIWSRGPNFIFQKDIAAYMALAIPLVDISKNLFSTTWIGYGLDKVFTSDNIKVSMIDCPHTRGRFMDHYPVVFEIE